MTKLKDIPLLLPGKKQETHMRSESLRDNDGNVITSVPREVENVGNVYFNQAIKLIGEKEIGNNPVKLRKAIGKIKHDRNINKIDAKLIIAWDYEIADAICAKTAEIIEVKASS